MEEKKTVQYKRTLRGTMGAGASALFNGNGRRFYVLQHRDASKYHKAGESQKIIVDQVELGRDANCQVRFDETFETVSRRHAAIVREGDRWKLVQLSTVNSTFLNGRPVESQWYLENGDEIQLAVGGPRLGFIIPEGKQGLVSSIKLTERMELFRKQALKPYKRAIAAMAVVLVLAIGGLGFWNYFLHDKVQKQETYIAQLTEISDSLAQTILDANKQIEGYERRLKELSTKAATAMSVANQANSAFTGFVGLTATKDIQACYPYVYYVEVTINNVCDNKGNPAKIRGTAFMLDDGRLVTAQHMVDFWSRLDYTYEKDSLGHINPVVIDGENTYYNILAHNHRPLDITWDAYSSSGDHLQYKYTSDKIPFTVGASNSKQSCLTITDMQFVVIEKDFSVTQSDWAYIQTNRKKGLTCDKSVSLSMPAKTRLDILGFPNGRGGENKDSIQPIYSESTIARDGLDTNGTIMLSNEETQGGNSGGPAFIKKKGKQIVVGVLTGARKGKDCLVPIANIK